MDVAPQVYELYLREDVCYPSGTVWWFHFAVSNVVPGVPYEFMLVNLRRKGVAFGKGMGPLMLSTIDAAEGEFRVTTH